MSTLFGSTSPGFPGVVLSLASSRRDGASDSFVLPLHQCFGRQPVFCSRLFHHFPVAELLFFIFMKSIEIRMYFPQVLVQ